MGFKVGGFEGSGVLASGINVLVIRGYGLPFATTDTAIASYCVCGSPPTRHIGPSAQ